MSGKNKERSLELSSAERAAAEAIIVLIAAVKYEKVLDDPEASVILEADMSRDD